MDNIRQENKKLLDDFINLRDEGREIYNDIFRYIDKMIKNYEDTEDILTEVQIKVFSKIEEYDSGKDLRPWLYSIAKNTTIDFLRREYKRKKLIKTFDIALNDEKREWEPKDQGISLEDSIILNEDRNLVRDAVESLPEKIRGPLKSFYFEKHKYHEIADELKIPIGSVKSRIFYAVDRLRRKIRAA